ncbi:MAG TPA: PQQ-binding-like beta-propeller repeat protein [Pirellulaceae bacterium]|nr:PQQ-binding-like beta-propeller repeat protein [Pirellulaceae bacterium]HMO91531.1 PQQ-binding-like beta-propeller repeat protein [Pirellulaceae bacterium]HMP68228.1 PQQ-binding-like beta-propeller repeat protein [Pirellulaceae bacterium]
MKSFTLFLTLSLSLNSLSLIYAQTEHQDGWVRFRGPNGTGVATETIGVPLSWNGSAHIRWRIELPGLGSSSPIVLGDKVFVTSYTGYGIDKANPGEPNQLKRHLICLKCSDGSEVWRATVDAINEEDPYQGFIQEHGYASSTPVSDGTSVYVFFGKDGVFAFDLEGNKQWQTSVGTQSDPAKWGGGASCMLVDDVLVVNAGNEGRAILGLSKSDGKEIWRVESDGFANSWSTPCLVEVAGRKEIVISVPDKIIAIDPLTGNQLWWAKSPVSNTTCPSLALGDNVVFAMGGRGGQAIAVRCGGTGDVSESHTVWQAALPAGIGTPLFANGRLYWNARGIGYCADAETGEMIYKDRLKPGEDEPTPEGGRRSPAGDYASPISVDGHLFYTLRNGMVYIVQADTDTLKVVSSNAFDDDDSLFNATPAVGNGELYFRSEKFLYCIGK